MVALPGQLFFGTQIPACLWILAKDKSNGMAKGVALRDRRGERWLGKSGQGDKWISAQIGMIAGSEERP